MKTWAANLLGAGVAAATLGVGLVVGGPEAMAGGPAHPVTIAAPAATGGADEVGLGQSMELFGRPARLSMFWTTDDADEVIRHYADAWKDSPIPPTIKHLDKVSSISVVDAESGLMRTVTVTDQGDQRVVVPSVMDVRAFPDVSARHAPVPIPDDAKGYLAQVTDDAKSVSYHASFVVALPPERALEFYKVELGKLGYTVGAPMTKSAAKLSSLTFSRGPEAVSVLAMPTEKHGPTASFVIVEHVRQIEGE